MRRLDARAQRGRTFFLSILVLTALVGLSLVSHSFRNWHAPDVATNVLITSLSERDADTADELCRDIHNHPANEQCAFVKKYCTDEDAGLLSYLDLYYCRLPHLKPIGFIIIVSWTGLLFTTIGVAASDFFCINLSTISSILGMSESMAGVTFLAFGNGSPDVFSTFAAIRSNSGSLAVGELIGAAGFITAVVSGSMALVRPFKVPKRSFVRDVGFFAVAVGFSMSFLANGLLTIYECAVMVGFYVFYVITVIIWHWWLERTRSKREFEAAARGNFVMEDEDVEYEENYRDNPEVSRSRRQSISRTITEQDLRDLEAANDEELDETIDELEEEAERAKGLGELNSNMRVRRPTVSKAPAKFNPIRPSLVGALEFRSVLSSLQKSRNHHHIPMHLRGYSDDGTPVAGAHADSYSMTSDPPPLIFEDRDDSSNSQLMKMPSPDNPRMGRGRAASASAADMLRPEGNRFQAAAPPSFEPVREEPRSPNRRLSSPRICLSPVAVDEPEREPRSTVPHDRTTRSRSSTGELLAPPAIRLPSHSRSRSRSKTGPTPPRSVVPSRQGSGNASPVIKRTTSNSNTINSRKGLASSETEPLLPPPSIEPEVDTFFQVTSNDPPSPKPLSWWPYSLLPPPEVIAHCLFPTLYNWNEKTIIDKLIALSSVPSFFFLTITLPVVEPEAAEDPDDPSQFVKENGASGNKTNSGSSNGHTPRTPSLPTQHSTADVAVNIERSHHHRPTTDVNGNKKKSTPTPSAPGGEHEVHLHAAVYNQREWNRWLVMMQAILSPFFVLLMMWIEFQGPTFKGFMKPALYCLLGSSIALLIILLTSTPTRPPRWHFFLTFVGFVVSITWISTIANEVVGVLKTIGVIFNISDAILGLTIFAVGNSLGDLVADITVAKLGFPIMALSACFGGPLLNILLGIGLSGLYMIIHHADHKHHKHPDKEYRMKPYKVDISPTLLISAVALLVTLVGLLIVVPLNKWVMDRKIGWGLIILWCICTIANVVVEVTGVLR